MAGWDSDVRRLFGLTVLLIILGEALTDFRHGDPDDGIGGGTVVGRPIKDFDTDDTLFQDFLPAIDRNFHEKRQQFLTTFARPGRERSPGYRRDEPGWPRRPEALRLSV